MGALAKVPVVSMMLAGLAAGLSTEEPKPVTLQNPAHALALEIELDDPARGFLFCCNGQDRNSKLDHSGAGCSFLARNMSGVMLSGSRSSSGISRVTST